MTLPVRLGVEDAGEAYCMWKRNNSSGGPHDPADRVCRDVLCSGSSLLYYENDLFSKVLLLVL